jgi:dTMP kinase
MENGVFIVAEGGEGSGKTSNLREIYNKLVELLGEDRVVLTKEPGGIETNKDIRRILLDKSHDPIKVKTELLLFCADRAEHCDVLIRPALEAGKIVLSDRFDGSTWAYQIHGRERFEYAKIFEEINAFARGRGFDKEITPDLVLFFDVEVEKGLSRVKSRNEVFTKFDSEEINFHKRVRDGFIIQCDNNPNWVRVDANPDFQTVQQNAWKAVESFLKDKNIL